jgi:predicted outer membrane repeat protein
MGQISIIRAICGLLLLSLSNAFGMTIHVPADQPTIQAGINAAVNGDTVLVAEGVYTGPGNRDIDFIGKGILVKSAGGADETIIECGGYAHRGFQFQSGEDSRSILDGFTVTGGYQMYPGGAVYIINASPKILNCRFDSNYAQEGGGAIYCNNSSVSIENCVLIANTAREGGGAIFCSGSSVSFKSCVLTSNTAYDGGAVYCSGSTISLENCVLNSNAADDGGAIYFSGVTASFENCVLNSNTGQYDGGAIYSANSDLRLQNCLLARDSAYYGGGISTKNSSVETYNCTFARNWANYGSAIILDSTSMILERSIMAFSDSGAAISYYTSGLRPISISCCDIYGNKGKDWNGVLAPFQYSDGNLSFDPSFCNIALGDYTLDSLSVCAPWNNSCGVLIGAYPAHCYNPNDNHPPPPPVSGFEPSGGEAVYISSPIIKWDAAADPDFDDPPATLRYEIKLNEYPDMDHNVYATFNIPSGENVLYITDSLQPNINWYYKIRTFDDQGQVSSWSEVQSFYIAETLPYDGPLWFVAINGDDNSGYGSPEHPYASIRLAVNAAKAGDTVLVEPGRYKGIYNRDIDFKGKNLFLFSAGGSAITTIDCSDPAQKPHRAVLLNATPNEKSVIRGLRITGGYVSTDSIGGGIFCDSAWLELVDCVIDSCLASTGGGLGCRNSKIAVTGSIFRQNTGPGIYCINSEANISNSQFNENYRGLSFTDSPVDMANCQFESNVGGGGYFVGANASISDCYFGSNKTNVTGRHLAFTGTNGDIIRCQFERNVDDSYRPGGITLSNCSPKIRDCYFSHLTGGALNIIGTNSNPLITSCQFIENSASNGAAANITSANPIFENCIFARNVATERAGGVYAMTATPVFRKCLFTGNKGYFGGAITLFVAPAEITNCTLVNDSGSWHGGEILCYSSSPIIDKSILAFSGAGEGLYCFDIACSPVISCTDIYGNKGGDWIGVIAGQANINGNFSLDPLFCEPLSGRFVVQDNSPCAPAGNSCHTVIGTFGYGCLWCGEMVIDGKINILDIVYLVRFLYMNGPSPSQLNLADVDHSGAVNLSDIIYLINFIYKQGSAPNCP